MSAGTINIWDGLNFANAQSKSAYDYLIEQSKALAAATGFELNVEVERVDSYLDGNPIIPVGVSKLYIIAPKLGNFRRKLITVVEGKYGGANFPVDVYCHIDDIKDIEITEAGFLSKINDIIKRPVVQASIISLFKQSKEVIDNSRLAYDIITSRGAATIYWFATPIYWSHDGSKGYSIRDIHGYDFPEPFWGKLYHIQENGDQYQYVEDAARNCINKPADQSSDVDNDLRSILEVVKNETIKRVKH